MREIKFRAWDKTARKMRQVIEIVFNAGMYCEPNDNTVKLIWVKGHDVIDNKDIALEREHKNEYILMQYTGLKDKNGIEIYEGDIVRIDCPTMKMTGEIKYSEMSAMFYIYDEIEDIEETLWYQEKEYKVIGNIYANPELLKGEENG